MAKVECFRDIIAWQKAHCFVLEVYKLTKKFPKEELYGLTSQLRRSATSVPSNIAEGFKRRGKKDSLQFYNIAQSSLEEARYQLLLARYLNYIIGQAYENVERLAEETSRALTGWMRNSIRF